MDFQKIKKTAPRIPELVMQAILQAVDTGRIKLNENLLPERELSAALGVGRGSLRECLAILEFLGVIESRGNRKVIVKTSSYIQNIIALIQLSEKSNTTLDVIEFRKANECGIVELACQHATEEDIEKIRDCIKQMEQDTNSVEADTGFHLALALASHSAIFATTLRLINSMIIDFRIRFFAKPDYHQITLTEHRAIFEAVLRRDKTAAKQAMKKHLENIMLFASNE
jgi:GntR family transcriptional repressor for pyruvate dehydrogenase complex